MTKSIDGNLRIQAKNGGSQSVFPANEIASPTPEIGKPRVATDVPVAKFLDRVHGSSIVVSGGRFIGRTVRGGSISISLSNSCERLTIRKIRRRDDCKPSSYVGRAPRREYLNLLKDVLALGKKQQC